MNDHLASLPLAIRADDSSFSGWQHHWGSEMGHMLFGSAMMLIFWGAVVLLAVLLVR